MRVPASKTSAPWPQEMIDFVGEQWNRGVSASNIAKALCAQGFHKSKNAVIRVVHNNGWARSSSTKAASRAAQVAVQRISADKARRSKPPKPKAETAPSLPPLAVEPLLVPIARLGDKGCRWVCQPAGESEALYCGLTCQRKSASSWRPYCPQHSTLVRA